MSELIKDVAGDHVFAVCALVSLGGALTVVLRRNPIYSALGLLVSFLAFAVIFLKLHAPFLAAMHILVYTGAILVLFLFVIMLLNLAPQELGREYGVITKAAVGVLCAGLLGLLAYGAWRDTTLREPAKEVPVDWGGVTQVGEELFNRWAFPFELVSVLVIVAILGAVILAKKKLPPES